MYNKDMEQNYDEKYWRDRACPKYDCRKNSCKCGLKKVFLPANLGDDSKDSPIAPQNGAYCNAIVAYESNNHIYIYTSEGVPVLVDSDSKDLARRVGIIEKTLATEISERKAGDKALQDEIDEMKNSPDVVDIVATYADLQAYDTSSLGDKDIIRVLADETHDDMTTYYRWNLETQTWTFIGGLGPYYTKDEVDEEIEAAYGRSKVLTTDDYNWNSVSEDTTEPYDSVALWLLDNGMYTVSSGFAAYRAKNFQAETASYLVSDSFSGPSYKALYQFETAPMYPDKNYGHYIGRFNVTIADGTLSSTEKFASRTMVEAIVSDYIMSGNGAPSGVPIEGAGLLYEDKTNGKLYQYDGSDWEEISASGGGVKELTSADYDYPDGTPTAVALWKLDPGMYYADTGVDLRPSIANFVISDAATVFVGADTGGGNNVFRQILIIKGSGADIQLYYVKPDGTYGSADKLLMGAKVQTSGDSSSSVMSQNAVTSMVFADPASKEQVQIGANADTRGSEGISIGKNASIGVFSGSVAIGRGSTVSSQYSVALGCRAAAGRKGEVNIGSGAYSAYGYNSTPYRVLGGVHDGQNNHDAATVAQGNTLSSSAPTTSTEGVLGQLWTDTTNMHTYQCTAISGSTYTWTQRW